MTQDELRTKYRSLYDYMAVSGNTEYMKAFGSVMGEMMDWFIINKPEQAQEWIEKLFAIKWDNYLTQREAERIVANMRPKAPWSRDVWRNAISSLGLAMEEEPHYNSCALWVVMNMIYSDSANTVAKLMGAPLEQIPTNQLVDAIHSLALDKLVDEDGVFNVRTYFGL